MEASGGNGDNIAYTGWNISHVAPDRYRAVALQRQTMITAGSDCDHIVQPGWNVSLAA